MVLYGFSSSSTGYIQTRQVCLLPTTCYLYRCQYFKIVVLVKNRQLNYIVRFSHKKNMWLDCWKGYGSAKTSMFVIYLHQWNYIWKYVWSNKVNHRALTGKTGVGLLFGAKPFLHVTLDVCWINHKVLFWVLIWYHVRGNMSQHVVFHPVWSFICKGQIWE